MSAKMLRAPSIRVLCEWVGSLDTQSTLSLSSTEPRESAANSPTRHPREAAANLLTRHPREAAANSPTCHPREAGANLLHLSINPPPDPAPLISSTHPSEETT
jgi:hypothetical protein